MRLDISSSNLRLIEKEYPYRYKWSSTLSLIIICGLGAFGLAWLALNSSWFWWLGSAFVFLLFLSGLYIAIINLFGNRRLILTKESIHLPSVWKSEKYTIIRFSDIKEIGLLTIQGTVILQLKTNIKTYEIVNTWLPSMDAFNEILDLTQERVGLPLDNQSPPS